jgi:hypothetical protein
LGRSVTEAELLELAWALICNASNRTIELGPVDATPSSEEWARVAQGFRTEYCNYLVRRIPQPGDRVRDGGQWGTLVRCGNCQDKNGLLFKPDNMPEPVTPEDPADYEWANAINVHSIYFVDGPVKGDHMYSDTLYPEILRHPGGGKSVNYWLIDDPTQDLLEYRYSIRKPE